VSNYSLQYFSNGQYPVPQTIIVVLIELIKLVATIIRSKCKLPSFSVQSLRSSLRFLLPSILYAVNNNIYYAGLTLVPPPIWLILCSVRTVVTATIYKFVLRRHLTVLQFVGAFLIVISIAVAKTPDIIQVLGWSQNNDLKVNGTLTAEAIQAATVNAVPLAAILLAGVASCNSGT
jgi:drug/metabolite transporter (DMT)-like permease